MLITFTIYAFKKSKMDFHLFLCDGNKKKCSPSVYWAGAFVMGHMHVHGQSGFMMRNVVSWGALRWEKMFDTMGAFSGVFPAFL